MFDDIAKNLVSASKIGFTTVWINVGHEYFAKEDLKNFYKKLDPTNSFNPGIGKTSKCKHWH